MFSGRRIELEEIISAFPSDTEQEAFNKIVDLCAAFEEVASAQGKQAGEGDTLQTLSRLLAGLKVDLLADRDKPDFLDAMRHQLESMRAGKLYTTIRQKIFSPTEYVSAADVLYFTAITNEPELINLYDVARCVEGLRECSLKSTLELMVDLRARTDKHFVKSRSVAFNESLKSCTGLTENALLVTRFVRKHATMSAAERNEPLFIYIKSKVEDEKILSDMPEIELLYYGLMSSPPDVHFQTLGALALIHKILKKESALYDNFNLCVNALLTICSNNPGDYQHPKMDAELLKKFHLRGEAAQSLNGPDWMNFYFLNLEKMDLRGLNLIGNNGLTYATLRDANLAYAHLDKATQVDFTRAHMDSVQLYSRVDASGFLFNYCWHLCCFQNAEFVRASIIELIQKDCSFDGATLDTCRVVLCKDSVKNLSDFTNVTFKNSRLENFNYLLNGQVTSLTLTSTTMRNSINLFNTPGSIKLAFTFTDEYTLRSELTVFKTYILKAVDKEKYPPGAIESLRNNMQLSAASSVISRVLSDDIPSELRVPLLEAASNHTLFQPPSTAAGLANEVSNYLLPKVYGLFSQPQPCNANVIVSSAQVELEKARDALLSVRKVAGR